MSADGPGIEPTAVRGSDCSCRKEGLWDGSSDDSRAAALPVGFFLTTGGAIVLVIIGRGDDKRGCLLAQLH
jgi:hypothetical protein